MKAAHPCETRRYDIWVAEASFQQSTVSEPDQKPGFLIGHILDLGNHLERCQHSFAPVPYASPSAPRVGEKGGQGEGEGAPAALRSTDTDTVATHPLRT